MYSQRKKSQRADLRLPSSHHPGHSNVACAPPLKSLSTSLWPSEERVLIRTLHLMDWAHFLSLPAVWLARNSLDQGNKLPPQKLTSPDKQIKWPPSDTWVRANRPVRRDKRSSQRASACVSNWLALIFCLWMWRNWPACTVKGNAIKRFRSLDYELQIALSGFKWQVFSHRALMESIFNLLSSRPLKTSAGLAARSY